MYNTDKRQYKFNDGNNIKHNNGHKKTPSGTFLDNNLKLLSCNSDLLCCNIIEFHNLIRKELAFISLKGLILVHGTRMGICEKEDRLCCF